MRNSLRPPEWLAHNCTARGTGEQGGGPSSCDCWSTAHGFSYSPMIQHFSSLHSEEAGGCGLSAVTPQATAATPREGAGRDPLLPVLCSPPEQEAPETGTSPHQGRPIPMQAHTPVLASTPATDYSWPTMLPVLRGCSGKTCGQGLHLGSCLRHRIWPCPQLRSRWFMCPLQRSHPTEGYFQFPCDSPAMWPPVPPLQAGPVWWTRGQQVTSLAGSVFLSFQLGWTYSSKSYDGPLGGRRDCKWASLEGSWR